MNRKRNLITCIFSAFAMALLIIDAKTALRGARDGIALCLYTVIPSLFPFFVFSNLLTASISELSAGFLRPLSKLFGTPAGTESLLLIGFLGGYPIGAQSIAQAHRAGQISRADARRMLGFVSNAGPAFIFGMTASLFHSPAAGWVLWGIQILSACIVSMLLPGRSTRSSVCISSGQALTVVQSLTKATYTMAGVCGWIVIFRVMIAFAQRWFLWLLPAAAQVALIGFLELSNGCCELMNISCEGARFLLCAVMLSFGGICVAMQTATVTGQLGTGFYLPGKILQCACSLLLAEAVQPLLFSGEMKAPLPLWIFPAATVGILLMTGILKNNSRNPVSAGV